MNRIAGVIASPVAAGHGSGLDDFPDGILIVVRINADHTAAGGGTRKGVGHLRSLQS
jgi:hypothetical protein